MNEKSITPAGAFPMMPEALKPAMLTGGTFHLTLHRMLPRNLNAPRSRRGTPSLPPPQQTCP